MKILKAFRFRLEPANEQTRKFSRYQGCMRFVWNKKKNRDAVGLRYPDAKQIKLNLTTKDQDSRNVFPKVFVPKVGWVKFRQSRDVDGCIKNATVTWRAGHWPHRTSACAILSERT
ncbi:MAG: helix-turn-helix domain-containing protein [Bacilli bacterium]